MNINRHHFLTIFITSIIFFSFSRTLLSQEARPTGSSGRERLAVISKYKGQVKVEHDTVLKTVTKIGNRIRNSSVYNEDTVLTMPVSMADLVFNDNTHLEVQEDTSLTISTRQITEEERAQEGFIRKVAGTQKEVVRNISLKIGKIWANITPSKSVLTEFEMPTGVATVRGTRCWIAHIVKTIIEVLVGELGFLCDIGTALLKKDTKIEVSVDKDKKVVTLKNIGKNPITINDITFGKNSTISAGVTKEGIKVISTNGEVTRNGKDVKPGDSIDDDSGADDSGAVYGAQILGEGGGGGG
ncbi:MAG: FecR domain-containing protein, partial [Thermodesulfobacteriota bacterium]